MNPTFEDHLEGLPPVLTSRDLVGFYRKPPSTIYEWLRLRRIPTYRIGVTNIVLKGELTAHLTGGLVKPLARELLETYGPTVTTTELAALLGVKPQTVTNWLRRGLLVGRRQGRSYVLVASQTADVLESLWGYKPPTRG